MAPELEIVLVDLDDRQSGTSEGLADLKTRREQTAAGLDDAQARIIALQRELDVPIRAERPAREAAATRRATVQPAPEWSEVARTARERVARQGISERAVDDLLGPEAIRRIERRFSGDFRIKTSLDRYDVVALATAGVVGGLVDFFLVRIPTDMPFPLRSGLTQKGSPITKWLQDMSAPHNETPLSGWAKVAYDRVNLTDTGHAIPGSGGRTHRFHTLGHDPLLGLVFGVVDILRGSTSAIDRAGNLVYIPGTAEPISNPLVALVLQLAHTVSDACTSMGVTPPGWSAFGAAQFGSIGPDDLTLAQVARVMYLKGYDLRHFLTQTTSVAAAELVLHLYWYMREAFDSEWAGTVEREWQLNDLTGSLDDRRGIRRLGQHPRYEALALGTHAIAAAANAGKIALMQGNPLALNYAQWLRFLHASYRYSQRFLTTPGDAIITAVWLNERALAGGWPELDWSSPDAPVLAPEPDGMAPE